MAVFPSDSIRTKNWGTEILTDSDLEAQLDLLHAYFQAALNATTGHNHDGTSNQGPKLTPANLVIASQAQGDLLYASSASAWARLGAGTSGQFLKTQGAGANPVWANTGGPSFSVNKNATDQTGIATATFTKLTWSTELYDSNSNFASDKFTPTVSGIYHIIGSVAFNSLGDGKAACVALYKNGSRIFFGNFIPNGAAYGSVFSGSWHVSMNGTTDYLELYCYHEHGSNRDASGGTDTTFFMGHFIQT